jgi:hypothetical protein
MVSVEKWNDWIDEIWKMNEYLNYPENWKWRSTLKTKPIIIFFLYFKFIKFHTIIWLEYCQQ